MAARSGKQGHIGVAHMSRSVGCCEPTLTMLIAGYLTAACL